MKVGTADVEPGSYSLKAQSNSSSFEIMQNGKVVAQVPCSWITLPKKAASDEVDMDNNKIVQVEFAGKTEAIKVR